MTGFMNSVTVHAGISGGIGLRDRDLEDEGPGAVRMASGELNAARSAARDSVDGDLVNLQRIEQRRGGVGLFGERATGRQWRPQVPRARGRDRPESGLLQRLANEARVMSLRGAVQDQDVGRDAMDGVFNRASCGLDDLRRGVERFHFPVATDA